MTVQLDINQIWRPQRQPTIGNMTCRRTLPPVGAAAAMVTPVKAKKQIGGRIVGPVAAKTPFDMIV
jgi:hypothetical protein